MPATKPAAIAAAELCSVTSARLNDIHWRDRPLLTMQLAAQIAGVSRGALYGLAQRGELKLKSLAGRTLVETASLIAMIERVEPWSPSHRAAKATAARSERSEAA